MFILREPHLTGPLVAAALGPGIACLPAPDLPGLAATPVAERDMADILANIGFADPPALALAVGRWRVLVDGCRPDLAVSDFAPSLRIAIAGDVPHVAIGNGFTMVPDVSPLPPFRIYQAHGPGESREGAVLAAANAVRERLGLAPLPRAAALLAGDRSFCSALAHLDPFAAYRTEPLIPPLDGARLAPGPPVAQRVGPDIFCYLDASDAAVNPLLTALNRLGRPAEVYIRNIDPAILAQHCAPHVRVHTRPADYRMVLSRVRLMIHAGTTGSAASGLFSGTPQLALPNTFERQLVTDALLTLGVAAWLHLDADADPIAAAAAIQRVLCEASLAQRAAAIAEDLRELRVAGAPEEPIVEACRGLLAHARMSR